MKFKGLIFDFNGVLLWDSQLHEDAWNKMSLELRNKPLTHEENVRYVHGRVNRDIVEYLAGRELAMQESEKMADRKEQLYREMCLAERNDFRLSPGAENLLNYLVQYNIPHTIATASPKSNVDFYIQYLNLARWFIIENIVHDDGTFPGKPAPDIYLKAAGKLGLDPASCIVVEDSKSGIEAAHKAGIGKIIALGPVENHEKLKTLQGVSATIADLGEFDKSLLITT